MQAYDNHMNLILSDVEETITIVDIDEAGGESVRVRFLELSFVFPLRFLEGGES